MIRRRAARLGARKRLAAGGSAIAAALVLALLSPAAAWAADADATGDADGDGRLTSAELGDWTEAAAETLVWLAPLPDPDSLGAASGRVPWPEDWPGGDMEFAECDPDLFRMVTCNGLQTVSADPAAGRAAVADALSRIHARQPGRTTFEFCTKPDAESYGCQLMIDRQDAGALRWWVNWYLRDGKGQLLLNVSGRP